MKAGIVGFSGTGKSTLFQALTGATPDPAAALSGQPGIARVADERLDHLTRLYHPRKTTPATVDLVDTPGLVRGKPEENPRRIAAQRNADALLVVLDGFSGAADPPAEQLRAFRDELAFADLEVVTNRLEKLRGQARKPRPAAERERDGAESEALERIVARLESGEPLSGLDLPEAVEKQLRSFQLFSLKPEMVVLNCAEDDVGSEAPAGLAERAPHVVTAAARLERDLAELDGEDRGAFMEEMGVRELARDRIVRRAFEAVGLIVFFTVGDDECRAWVVRRGASAVEAASAIHSDIARGFIRAEVFSYADLADLGSEREIRARGRHRLEGREYRVADGDVINFRFNV